jgi:hypothetical protein
MTDTVIELRRFIGGDCDPATLPIASMCAWPSRCCADIPSPETVLHFSQALRQMAARAGRPEAYHETITIAFLSVIAERMGDIDAFDAFASANPDLLDKRVLARWYGAEQLASDRARRTFVLPQPRA